MSTIPFSHVIRLLLLVYGNDPDGSSYGFEEEIKAQYVIAIAWMCMLKAIHGRYFPGFVGKDVAFYHVQSKTLIEADLLFNLPAKEQYSKSKSSGNFPFISYLKPHTWLHRKFLGGAAKNKEWAHFSLARRWNLVKANFWHCQVHEARCKGGCILGFWSHYSMPRGEFSTSITHRDRPLITSLKGRDWEWREKRLDSCLQGVSFMKPDSFLCYKHDLCIIMTCVLFSASLVYCTALIDMFAA